MRGRLVCKFCGEMTAERPITSAQAIEWMSGLYLAHLIESHWPELVDARNQRVLQPMNERTLSAWKRL